MLLCVIIPALNEEATLGKVMTQIREVRLPAPVDACALVVVDDGSTDRTAEIAAELGAAVVQHPRNRGVGRAFHSGLEKALALGADVVVNIDADGQFNPADIPQLIGPIIQGRADFCTASRFKDPALEPEMPPVKRWGNRQMSRLVSAIVGRRFDDVSCGFRAYSRETALRLNLWGEFTYTQETLILLCARGLQIEEIPLRVRGVREVGESRVARNLWTYARRSSAIIFHAYRDFWPMRFFGILGALALVPGLGCLSILALHWLRTGRFSPHIWAGFTGGSFVFLALACFLTGLLGSMLRRIRLNQEEMLYYLKSRHYQALRKGPTDAL